MTTQVAEKREARQAAEAAKFVELAHVCNVSEQLFVHSFDYGEVRIEACEPGEEYRVTPIEWRASRMNLGDKSTVTEISALDIARDVVRLSNGDVGEHSFTGVFLCDGPEPKPAELRKAHEKLRKRYEWAVANARGEWERSHRTDWITDEQRRAAAYLNLTAEAWMAQAQGQELCEGCGIAHMPGIAKCGHCGAILDRAKAEKLGLLPPHLMLAQGAATPPVEAKTKDLEPKQKPSRA